MSLFKKSFKISQLKNNRWHVIEVGTSLFNVFRTFDEAVAYIKKQIKEENETSQSN